MTMDRSKIMQRALEELGVEVWTSTRYANDSGTCMRCVTGTLVMVPDDPGKPHFFQADGAEELEARVNPVFERLADEAAGALRAGGPRAALLAAGDALFQEGYESGYEAALNEARVVFEKVVLGKFGALPPALSVRIQQASFADMAHWADRIAQVRHATALIV
jgi:hypothetical protein